MLAPEGVLEPGTVSPAVLQLRNLGVTGSTTGGVTVTVASGDPGVTLVDNTAVFPDLGPSDTAWPNPGEQFILAADPGVVPGTVVEFYLDIVDGGDYVGQDTLSLRIGTPTVVFADAGDVGLTNWTAGNWGVETVDGNPAFSDSPTGDYASNTDNRLTLNFGLDLSGAVIAVLRFNTQWNIEGGYDFAWVEASTDGGSNWTALAGDVDPPRARHEWLLQRGDAAPGDPGYDGNKRFWAREEVDLTPYAGLGDVRLRFRVTSDGGLQQEGWLLDDLEVLVYDAGAPLAEDPAGISPVPAILRSTPNPFRDRTRISYSVASPSPVKVSVFDVSGRLIRVLSEGFTEAGQKSLVWDGTSYTGRRVTAGAYFLRVETPAGTVPTASSSSAEIGSLPMSSTAVKLSHVRKSFGSFRAVDNVSLEVAPGSVTGFLGPNGAGKTTTIRMIMNILVPDSGTIEVLGTRAGETTKTRIGYLPEERGLYKKMRVIDHLLFFAELKGMTRRDANTNARALLNEFELEEWTQRKVQDLSKGMQQKVQFIGTIVHAPELLILDEPFSGLDPVNVEILKDKILGLREAGCTILFSTHVMDQAEKLCDSVILINQGQKVLDGTLQEVKQGRFGENAVILDYDGEGQAVRSLPMVGRVNDFGKHMEVYLHDGTEPQEFLEALVPLVRVHRFEVRQPTLNEIFIRTVRGSDSDTENARRARWNEPEPAGATGGGA